MPVLSKALGGPPPAGAALRILRSHGWRAGDRRKLEEHLAYPRHATRLLPSPAAHIIAPCHFLTPVG